MLAVSIVGIGNCDILPFNAQDIADYPRGNIFQIGAVSGAFHTADG